MKQVTLKTQDGRCVARHVMVASSFRQRLFGLLGMTPLSPEQGLMLSPGGSIHTFGMRYPIDVAFLDSQLRILQLRTALLPWRVCRAPSRTRYVVELPSGALDRLQLQVNTFMCLDADAPALEPAMAVSRACASHLRFSLRMPEGCRCSAARESQVPKPTSDS